MSADKEEEKQSCFTLCQSTSFSNPFSFSPQIQIFTSKEQKEQLKEPLIKKKVKEPDTEIMTSYAPPVVPLLSKYKK